MRRAGHATLGAMNEVLLCSAAFIERAGDRLEAAAPGLERVVLSVGGEIAPDDIERVTIAHFSSDLWPEHHIPFFVAALKAERLRWFHTMSAGVDSPPFQAMMERGVRLSNSSGTSAVPIAHTAMMYLLALSQGLPDALEGQAEKAWRWTRWRELPGRSIAVVGWGPIGQEVARLADALGMRVTIVRRAARGDEPYPVRPLDDLVDVAHDHDVMVLALPLTDDTAGVVDAAVLRALGPDGLFVNVGRGELVDQTALIAALHGGELGGAGLDVTTPEPPPVDDPVWDAPNLILTPHNSGATDGTVQRSDDAFFDNLAAWLDGERLLSEVTPSPATE